MQLDWVSGFTGHQLTVRHDLLCRLIILVYSNYFVLKTVLWCLGEVLHYFNYKCSGMFPQILYLFVQKLDTFGSMEMISNELFIASLILSSAQTWQYNCRTCSPTFMLTRHYSTQFKWSSYISGQKHKQNPYSNSKHFMSVPVPWIGLFLCAWSNKVH